MNRLFFVSERANELFAIKNEWFTHLLFIMSNLSESLSVTLLSWATWVNNSQPLFWNERPERFSHSRSFHLSWAIWANCSQSLIWSERSELMSNEWMSEFPTLMYSMRHSTELFENFWLLDSAESNSGVWYTLQSLIPRWNARHRVS